MIVSGPPGTGKTSVCRALATAGADGLHLDSDVFYRFPGRPIDPSRPAARAQNGTVIRALGASAAAFVRGGYRVFLDGIVGPWFLDDLLGTFRGALGADGPVDYVVLDAALDRTLARGRARLVGYASCVVVPKLDDRRGFLFVDELHVLRAARRRGVARALLAAIADRARAQGLRGVRLLVREENEPARALYASAGYRARGTVFCERLL